MIMTASEAQILQGILSSVSVAASSISYIGGTTGGTGCTTNTTSGSGTCTATYSPTSGDAVAMFFRPQQTAQTPYAADNNLFTMQQGSSVNFNTGYALSSFAMFAKPGASAYTVTGMATADSIVLGEYSGVQSINLFPTVTCPGNTLVSAPPALVNGCTGTGTLASATVALDDANDYAVCGFTQGGTNALGVWQAPFTGTLRQSYTSAPTMVLVDNTTNSAGTVAISASLAASTTWRAACIELRTVTNPQTFNIAQITPSGYGSITGPINCTVTSLTCSWAIASTTAGSLLAWTFSDHSDFNDIQRTITSLYTCRTSNPCLAGSADLVDTAVLPGSACQAYVQDTQPESDSQDTAYVLSSGGGATIATATRSGTNSTAERQIYAMVEMLPVAGNPYLFDACGKAQIATPASSFNITSVTLGGSNDVIIQGITGGQFALNVTSPYFQGSSIPQHHAVWVGVGLSSGSAPTITSATAVNGAAGVARAFKLTH